MSENLQEIFLREIRRLLLPLAVATENDFRGQLLFDLTGWNLEAGSDPAIDQRLVEFIDAYESLDDLIEEPPETLTDVLEVLDKVNQLVSAVRLVKAQPGNEGQGPEELGKDLISALVIGYLKIWHPAVYDVLAVLTVIRPPADISLDRIPDLITDPLKVLGAEYLKPEGLITAEDAKSVTDRLFPRLAALLVDSGVQAVYGVKPENGPDLGEIGNHLGPGILTVFLQPDFEKESRYSVMFALSPRDLGNLGLVVIPFGEPLPYWNVYVDLTAAAEGFAIGPQGLKILGASDKTSVSIRPSVFKLPGVLIGSAKGSRLEIGQFHISGDANLDPSNLEYGLLLDMGPSTLVISADDGDGFLQEILPADGIRADFDLAIGWSNKKGLYFRGSAGLDAELPVNRSLFGALTLNSVHLSIETDGSGIQSSVATSMSAQLGPVKALVDGAGLKTNFSFPDVGGNLGLLDLSLGFKPPSGIGLAISAPGVHGGGFLHFDPQKKEYSGIVELLIGEKIAVKALGLLVTRLPGGSKGYSLLIIITAEGFQPIPLPMGFRLTGIGGLLAINRTFAEDALRAGLKNHALDSVLFPQDPIRNAPQILSNLNRVFPPVTGHYLFGPMAQIEWGTPTLVTAQVAVVLEFGARLRLLVLAQIVAILPRPEQDLIRLQMDAVGVVDFDQGTAALDATLHDSRLLQKFVMTGDMALRLKLAAPPNFALAVGGLHPAFNPPPNFPKLERITINLAAGDNPRIRCEAYFALTGSSIQFGARAELYAKAAGFSIQGEIGFDVLIQRDPFAFLAEFYAKVQLKRGSSNLFMVKVEGVLAGPRPLHVKAKATFEILWWDVSIRVDRTLVAGEKPPLPAPIDVLPRLLEALEQPGSWTARLPASQRPVVTLRGRAAGEVQLHPLGQLTVSQSIVPLDMDISRFGDAAPAGARRFTIRTASPGWQTLQAVREFFAPAQFFEMSDAEKLSRPSFESMPAGVSLGSEGFSISPGADDWLEVPAIQFETIIVGQEQDSGEPTPPKDVYQLSPLLLDKQARFGAAANSVLRRTGTAKYRTTAGKHQVAKKGWSIVSTDDLKVQAMPGIEERTVSYSEAEQALRKLKQQDPAKASGLKILRLFEVQGRE